MLDCLSSFHILCKKIPGINTKYTNENQFSTGNICTEMILWMNCLHNCVILSAPYACLWISLYTEVSKILSGNIYMTTWYFRYTRFIIDIMQCYSWYIFKDFCIAWKIINEKLFINTIFYRFFYHKFSANIDPNSERHNTESSNLESNTCGHHISVR